MNFIKALVKFLKKPVNNRRGIALIMAVSTVSLLIYVAMEVMYDSNVEFVVNSQAFNRLKAYYAAKAGVDISLLRIKTYLQIRQKLGQQAAAIPFLEQIWQFPLVWPLDLPDSMNSVSKDEIKKKQKASIMDATFRTDIEEEGSRIDLNDLASPSKVLREAARKQILQIFDNQMKSNDDFRNKYSNTHFDELVNFIADWMSSKRDSYNGGDKNSHYRDSKTQSMPPSRGFRTLQELHLVNGMTDEIYDLLEPRVTIYGIKGINPNAATKEVLMTLDPGITAEVADRINKRVHGTGPGMGPFRGGEAGVKEFWDFVVNTVGARITADTKTIPIVTDVMLSFRITSTGLYSGATRKITAISFDVNQSANRISDYVSKENPTPTPVPTSTPNPQTPFSPAQGPGSQINNDPPPKGPPRIVYWSEI